MRAWSATSSPEPARRRLSGLVIDPAPLRLDRDFRLLWLGQAVSNVGRMITSVVLPYQVYVLTGNVLAVGAASAVIGSAIGGMLLVASGVAFAYRVDAVTFGAIVALLMIAPIPRPLVPSDRAWVPSWRGSGSPDAGARCWPPS